MWRRIPAAHRPRRASAVASAALLLAALAACGPPTNPDSGTAAPRLEVAVSVPPLAYLVDRVGAERVAVEVMIPPGFSPHDFEPSPQQIAGLSDAALYVAVGHPDFSFEKRYIDPVLADRPELPIVRLTDFADELPPAGDEDDPHLWLSPAVMTAAAGAVAEVLEHRDPAHADLYRHNLDAFRADVVKLDAEIRRQLTGLAGRAFFIYHPAWGPFAAEYGLEQVAIERAGKEPSPRQLARLIERARAEGATTIFVQKGAAARPARALAAELGVEVVPLDPLAYNWPDALRTAASDLHDALAAAADGAAAPADHGT